MKEANITIGGVPLSTSQAMTLRVAVSSFVLELSDEKHRAALGAIGELYREHARVIERMLAHGCD